MSAQIPRSRRKAEPVPVIPADAPDPRVDQWFAFLSEYVDPHLTEFQRGKIRELSTAVLQSTYNRAYIDGARAELGMTARKRVVSVQTQEVTE